MLRMRMVFNEQRYDSWHGMAFRGIVSKTWDIGAGIIDAFMEAFHRRYQEGFSVIRCSLARHWLSLVQNDNTSKALSSYLTCVTYFVRARGLVYVLSAPSVAAKIVSSETLKSFTSSRPGWLQQPFADACLL